MPQGSGPGSFSLACSLKMWSMVPASTHGRSTKIRPTICTARARRPMRPLTPHVQPSACWNVRCSFSADLSRDSLFLLSSGCLLPHPVSFQVMDDLWASRGGGWHSPAFTSSAIKYRNCLGRWSRPCPVQILHAPWVPTPPAPIGFRGGIPNPSGCASWTVLFVWEMGSKTCLDWVDIAGTRPKPYCRMPEEWRLRTGVYLE